MKNFNNFGVHGKMQVLEVGVHKNIRVAWTVFRFKGGLGKKEGWWCFWGGLIPQCTLCCQEGARIHRKVKIPKIQG